VTPDDAAPDRRKDRPQRTRVDEIGRGYERSIEDMQRWLRRSLVGLFAIAISGLLMGVILFAIVQGGRLQASRNACLARNDGSDTIVRVLIEVRARPEVVQIARKEGPRVRDCETFARSAITGLFGFSLLGGDPVDTPPGPPLTRREVELCGKTCVR
jgi:hypothetical protein